MTVKEMKALEAKKAQIAAESRNIDKTLIEARKANIIKYLSKLPKHQIIHDICDEKSTKTYGIKKSSVGPFGPTRTRTISQYSETTVTIRFNNTSYCDIELIFNKYGQLINHKMIRDYTPMESFDEIKRQVKDRVSRYATYRKDYAERYVRNDSMQLIGDIIPCSRDSIIYGQLCKDSDNNLWVYTNRFIRETCYQPTANDSDLDICLKVNRYYYDMLLSTQQKLQEEYEKVKKFIK